MFQKKQLFKFVIYSSFFIFSQWHSLALALDSDKTKKLYLTSETADMNRTTGVGIFKGNVVIDQGTTHATGDEMVTHTDKNNRLIEVIITSTGKNLATYKTLPEEGKPYLVASAQIIKYYPQEHKVFLFRTATVTQGKNSISGDQLEYNIEKQLLNSNHPLFNNSSHSRTTIVIEPDNTNHPIS